MDYKLQIKKYRIIRGLTQHELAKKANVKQSYISQLESNGVNTKSPTLRIVFRIAKALDVCPHVLVEYNVSCCQNCLYKCKQNFFKPL